MEEQRRRNRIAVAVAAVAGFITGVALTLLLPEIGELTGHVSFSLPMFEGDSVTVDFRILSWLLTAVVSGIIGYNAYELTLLKLTAGRKTGISE